MSKHKVRVGKNVNGWFVAIPNNLYGYDVMEDVGSFESAVALADHLIYQWGAIWR